MNEATRALVRVSAVLAAGWLAVRVPDGTVPSSAVPSSGDGLEAVLREAAAVADPDAVEEALLQSYLFLGYPAALRALGVWRRVSGRAAPPPRDDDGEWAARGAATCARVYGGQYDRLRSNVAALHPDMERWMIVEGYGKVLGRAGLKLATRELCIVALLAPQDATPQLYSHLRGALNAGAGADEINETIAVIAPLLTAERAAVLREQWSAVQGRRTGTES